jgi:beta-N-acetylhexosaminidase
MSGAKSAGQPAERARAALDAGCDMVLVCQNSEVIEEILDRLAPRDDPVSQMRLVRMHGRHAVQRDQLAADFEYQQARDMVVGIG